MGRDRADGQPYRGGGWPWVKDLFADGAYDRTQLIDKVAFLDFVIEVVRHIDAEPCFKVLPRRWVVERTFGWLTRWRRLVRDYEQRIDFSEAMIHVVMEAFCSEGSATNVHAGRLRPPQAAASIRPARRRDDGSVHGLPAAAARVSSSKDDQEVGLDTLRSAYD